MGCCLAYEGFCKVAGGALTVAFGNPSNKAVLVRGWGGFPASEVGRGLNQMEKAGKGKT